VPFGVTPGQHSAAHDERQPSEDRAGVERKRVYGRLTNRVLRRRLRNGWHWLVYRGGR
jgi:hypothetical protein